MRKLFLDKPNPQGYTDRSLDDFNSFDAWDSGMTPGEGAEECIGNDELYCDALDDEDFGFDFHD